VVTVPPVVLSRITDLELENLTRTQGSLGSKVFLFENLKISSVDSLQKALGASIDTVDVGSYIDIIGALLRLGDDTTSGKEYADKRRSTSAVGISILEADQMACMAATSIPIIFNKTAGKSTPMDEDSGFGYKMDTHAKFSGAMGKSVRTELQELLEVLTIKIMGPIGGTSTAERLATHLSSAVVSQLNTLLSFFSDYHLVLTTNCHYPSKTAWKFIGVCFRAMCNYLMPPRIGVSALDDLKARPVRAQIIWATLQVHTMFNEIVKAGFKSHPVLTRAMADFIMKNRIDGAQLEAVEKRLGALETGAKTSAAELKTLKFKKG
jgi:hypothetical protein